MQDGKWLEEVDSASITAHGRIVTGMSLGDTPSEDAARAIMQAQLATYANPLITVQAKASALAGAQLYVDYQLGDTIKVPGHAGSGTMSARVLSDALDMTADVVQTWPADMVKDGSV
jgi:hypothetical protein